MSVRALAISELVNKIKRSLEGDFRSNLIIGEVSNLTSSYSGHWYFTLSDEEASISVALFKGDALRNPLIKKIKEGDQLIVNGGISVYTKRGTFQIIAKSIQSVGIGELKIQFEKLKAKLAKEGLFSVDTKKTIPKYPKKIAVITSEDGAALKDFVTVYKRRSLWHSITVVPSLVQGDKAALSIRKCLEKIQNFSEKFPEEAPDVVVLTRGGGSLEDLWAFNDEGLARDIFDFDIPIISAVGHQPDTSISDYVADKACETPTAAAEFLTHSQSLLVDKFQYHRQSLNLISKNLISIWRDQISKLNPLNVLQNLQEKKSLNKERLQKLGFIEKIDQLVKIEQRKERLEQAFLNLEIEMRNKIECSKNTLNILEGKLLSLSPDSVLKRGFCFAKNEERLIKSAEEFEKINIQEKLKLVFHDGQVSIKKSI